MKATITRIVYYNEIEEMGDDMILVKIFFRVGDSGELRIPVMIHLDNLFRFVAGIDKVVGKYLLGIRKGIDGYGPKESIVMATLKEEGFDIDKWVEAYFLSLDQDFMESSLEQDNEMKKNAPPEGLNKKLKELDSYIVNNKLKERQIKHIAFLEAIDKALHETTFSFYPEVFEMGDKHEYAYKNLLVGTVMGFVESLEKIRMSRFTDYFEEDYKRSKEEGDL